MARIATILGLLVIGAFGSYIRPIFLPTSMTNAISDVVGYLYLWDGILPISTLFYCLAFVMLLELCILIYNLFKWITG